MRAPALQLRLVWRALAAAVVVAGVLTGCAYRLGPSSGIEAGSRSVAVLPFENATLEPRVTESISTALRQQLQQEGSFKLTRRDDADVVLTGVVRSIVRSEQSFAFQDTRHVRDYRLEIVARVTATERGTGRKVLDREVTGHTTMRVQSDLPSAERQAMPLLAANLARNITSMLVDGTW
jgi:outer membrane lipopolysaccharide assembly protein LptE/RlpB